MVFVHLGSMDNIAIFRGYLIIYNMLSGAEFGPLASILSQKSLRAFEGRLRRTGEKRSSSCIYAFIL